MWVKKDPKSTNIKHNTLLELLKLYSEEKEKMLERFAQHSGILSGVMIALFAAGGVSLTCQSGRITIIAFFIPLFVVCLRGFSIDTLDRYYLNFLEMVVCINKIEVLLGLNRPVWPSETEPEPNLEEINLFKEDTVIGVKRWLVANTSDQKIPPKSSEWILSKMDRGHNEVIWRFFRLVVFGSCFIPIVAVIKLWGTQSSCAYSHTEPDVFSCPLYNFFMNTHGTDCLIVIAALLSIFIPVLIYLLDTNKIKEKRRSECESKQ